MKLMVNDTEVEVTCSTLQELIDHYDLNPEHVVAEVDGEIVDRATWPEFGLRAGAKVELVHFVGGG